MEVKPTVWINLCILYQVRKKYSHVSASKPQKRINKNLSSISFEEKLGKNNSQQQCNNRHTPESVNKEKHSIKSQAPYSIFFILQ